MIKILLTVAVLLAVSAEASWLQFEENSERRLFTTRNADIIPSYSWSSSENKCNGIYQGAAYAMVKANTATKCANYN